MMRLAFISTLLAFSLYSVAAQDLTPSPTWMSQNITLSKEDHTTIAKSAIDKAISMLTQYNAQFTDGNYGNGGILYAQMAEFDRLTSQTMYKNTLKIYSTLAEQARPGFSNGKSYGYAAARAYTAYRDPDFLTLAATSWASARRYTISLEQAATGTMETKQFTLASSCNSTLAGGTYDITDPNNSYLDGLASGMFLVVSALLAEVTSNQTYIDAAVESAAFIQSNLLTPSNIVRTSIESNSNKSSRCSVSDVMTPYGSGTFIEGLAILAGISHNTSTESLLCSAIFNVANNSLWHEADRVYYRSDNGGHYIVQALASLYERNKTSSDLREYINEYISVQYNAVIEQARSSSDKDIYGSPWIGPRGTSFDSVKQTAALTALLSAIQLPDNPITSTTSLPPQSSSGSASSAKKDSAGTIAGSVVGGIVLLAALIFGTLFLRKLHRQRNDNTLVVNRCLALLTPFMTTQNMASSGISREQHQRDQEKPARFSGVAMEGESSSLGATDNGLVGTVGVQVASPENPPPGDRREHTLMEELLRTLNNRVLRDPWNEEELPPNYHEG